MGNCKLGLMPEDGIARIITPALPHSGTGTGVPRCELYLLEDGISAMAERAKNAAAPVAAPAQVQDRDHRVAYFADPDRHVIALAQPLRA